MENLKVINLKEVGARIRNARKALSLTQQRAAERAFITSQFWSLVETGHNRASVNTYRQIASVLGLTLDDIFYDKATTLRLHKAFSKEELLASCTTIEKIVISEMILELKRILEQNRRL